VSCWRMKQYPPGRAAGDRINDETRTHSASGSAVNAGQPCDRGCRRGLPRVYDDCSTRAAVSLTGHNVGDNLNAAGVSWGLSGRFRTHHRLPDRFRCRGHRQDNRRGWHQLRHQGRLHRPPRAVPALPLHRQPASPAAGVAVRDRHRHQHGRGAAVRRKRSTELMTPITSGCAAR